MAVIEKNINHLVNTSERSGIILNALIKDASLPLPPPISSKYLKKQGRKDPQ